MEADAACIREKNKMKGIIDMKLLKSSWRTCLAVVAGFVMGAVIFHTPASVEAQSGYVSVERVFQNGTHGSVVAGSRIVGFSCIPMNGDSACYVATLK